MRRDEGFRSVRSHHDERNGNPTGTQTHNTTDEPTTQLTPLHSTHSLRPAVRSVTQANEEATLPFRKTNTTQQPQSTQAPRKIDLTLFAPCTLPMQQPVPFEPHSPRHVSSRSVIQPQPTRTHHTPPRPQAAAFAAPPFDSATSCPVLRLLFPLLLGVVVVG
jgi:hypothetical protein